MNIDKLALDIHKLAWEKGWHSHNETEDHFVERTCNNIHNEISELHEAWRNNKLHELCDKYERMLELGIDPLSYLEEEFADIIIRCLDGMKRLGIENIEDVILRKHEFNKNRLYRHGNKRS